MGTNYYANINTCKCCNRTDVLHLGKSSAGWTFSFQAIENEHLGISVRDYDAWLKLVMCADRLYDEYGTDCTVNELVNLVEAKRSAPNNHTRYMHTTYLREHPYHAKYLSDDWLDKYGNAFSINEFS